MLYVSDTWNVFASIERMNTARSPPAIPVKNELNIKASSLCLNKFTPIASAAISFSLIALKARPSLRFFKKNKKFFGEYKIKLYFCVCGSATFFI